MPLLSTGASQSMRLVQCLPRKAQYLQLRGQEYLVPGNSAFSDGFADILLVTVSEGGVDMSISDAQGIKDGRLDLAITIFTLKRAESDGRNLLTLDSEVCGQVSQW